MRPTPSAACRCSATPSADFDDQEFDDAAEIGGFCQRNYGVTFPMTEKMSVRADPRRCGRT